MSVAEQALLLLDLAPNTSHRQSLENFPCLDSMISASLGMTGEAAPADAAAPTGAAESLYSVASRMGRTNYEERAKDEALFEALRQLKAQNARRALHASRVLRGT